MNIAVWCNGMIILSVEGSWGSLSETWLWSRTSAHRYLPNPLQGCQFSHLRCFVKPHLLPHMYALLPHRGSVSGAESNFAGFREPNMPWLRRISEATRTPSSLASFDEDGGQQEFELASRAFCKPMVDIKLVTSRQPYPPASAWAVVGDGSSWGSSPVAT